MTDLGQRNLSFKQAIYLALTVLCIYYPITIYVNFPREHWKNLEFLAFHPAIVNFIFYFLLVVVTDRVIEESERLLGPRMLKLGIGTIALSIVVAIVAVALSQLVFKLNFRIWSILMDTLGQEEVRRLGERPPRPFWDGMRRTNNGLTIAISISIFYLILNRKAQLRMHHMEIRAKQLMQENAVAQFEALKNQISPHFLFNSLSILSSLVHIDANLSERFIDQLSRAYRYILEHKDNETVSLKTELEFLRSYAFLLKIRFEHKFDVHVSITDQEAEKYQIAPLTLQLLIENCVKHNRMSLEDPLIVSIQIEDDHLVVVNPLRPRSELEKVKSTGIGLTNIKNRYQLLTKSPVHVAEVDELFTVKIPLI